MFKKLISGALSVSLLVSAAVSGNLNSLVTDQTQISDKSAKKSEYSVEGTNSLGKMIGDAYSDQTADKITPLSAGFSEKRFEISDLDFDLETGIINVNSTQDMDCELVVSFIDDDNIADTINIKAHLCKGENISTELSVDTSRLPEFYNVCAVLEDHNGYELSKKHYLNNYTRFKQKINSATVEDFDEDHVVNLDEDATTNFFVLSEETVIAESSENTNTLVSADYETDTYVFENIDDTIRNLKEGDCLYIRPNETDIIAVDVDSIKVNGNRSEIKGTGNAEDVFEFVKIEFDESDIDNVRAEEINEDKTIKLENVRLSEEGAALDYEIGDFSDEYKADDMMGILSSLPTIIDIADKLIPIKQIPIGLNTEIELSKDFYPFGKDEKANLVKLMSEKEDPLSVMDDPLNAEAKIGAKLTVAFKANLNFYWYNEEVEIAIDASLGATLKVGGSVTASYTFDLPAAYFSFYNIVDIGACPELTLKGELGIYATVSFAIDFNFFYNNLSDEEPKIDGKFYKLATSDSAKEIFGNLLGDINNSFVVTGNVSVIFDPCLGIWFVNKHIISGLVGMPITFTIECKAETDELSDLSAIVSSKSVHYCSPCSVINTSVSFGINIKMYLPIVEEVKKDLASKTYKLDKYYYSPFASGKKFGKGECPYRLRPVTIEVTGNEDYPSQGLTVIVDGKNFETSTEGQASFYAKPCYYEWNEKSKEYVSIKISHTYVIKSGEEELAKGTFTFDSDNTTVKVEITKTSKNNTINTRNEKTTQSQPVTEPATDAPYTPLESAMDKVKDDHLAMYAGKLGENIRYTIYKNGYMVIDGYGEMNRSKAVKGTYGKLPNFSSNDEKALVKNVVIKDSEADLKQLLTDEYVLNSYIIDNANDLVKAYNDSDNDEKNDIEYFGILSSENEAVLKKYINNNMNVYKQLLDDYKDSILENANGECITNICSKLFENCENLETVVLPANIQEIGSSAFSGCTRLKSITYKGSTNADKNIDLPTSVTSIGYSAFKGCSSLEGELDFNDYQNLVEIGVGAFYGTGINSLIISDNIKSLPIDSNGHHIAQFGNCPSLTKATINCKEGMISGRSLSKIFDDSTGLEELTVYNAEEMLNNISSCGCGAYSPAKHLHGMFYKYAVPNSLETIILKDDEKTVYGTFTNMDTIKTIKLPEKLQQIEGHSFWNCSSLETIEIPETVEEIGQAAFDGCTSLKTISIPNTVTIIPSFCFRYCASLESVNIPDSVEEIGLSAFEGCTSLKTIFIPNKVTIIPSRCFIGCSSLETLIIPEGVKEMQNNSSEKNWNSLKGIYIPRSLKTMGNDTFGVVINDIFSNEGTVYYGGTEEEWEKLKTNQNIPCSNAYYKSEYNFNDSIFNTKVIFNAKPEDMTSYTGNTDIPESSQSEFVPTGDVTGDGIVGLADALAILQYIANSNKYPISEEALKQADVYNTGDGITPMDALVIQKLDAGLYDSLPVIE